MSIDLEYIDVLHRWHMFSSIIFIILAKIARIFRYTENDTDFLKSNPVLTPISFSSRFDDFFIEPLFRHPDGRPPELCLLPKPFNPADAGKIRN